MAEWHRGDTRNPETILIAREERACKGCIHVTTAWGMLYCLKQQKPAKRKCSRHKEAE